MKRITKLIYLALGSCLIAGLNASCELVSENYGDINTSIFPKRQKTLTLSQRLPHTPPLKIVAMEVCSI